MPSFSIILPVRNGGEYVKQCVNSLLVQQHNNFNILVLDNNSTDGTLEWLHELNDSRISIFPYATPLDICGNWGRIAGLKKNEFMTMIGSDDILLPNYLTEMEKLIAQYPEASLYQTHFEFIDATGGVMYNCKPMRQTYTAGEYVAAQLTRTLDSMGTGYMMRSADYDALGGIPVDYPNLIFADYALWVQLISKSFFAVSPVKAFQYRLHNSVSRVTNGEAYARAFLMYLNFLKEQGNKHDDIKEAIQHDGKAYLLYFCESLSHRLLKTPFSIGRRTVTKFIDECIHHAHILMPQQEFLPRKAKRIKAAEWFDKNSVTRLTFKIIKKMTLFFGS